MLSALQALFDPTVQLPKNVSRVEIPSGNAGTAATIKHMARLALTGARSPEIRTFAIRILKGQEGVPAAKDRDFRQYVTALYTWVKKKIIFVHDPIDIERVEDPRVLLREGGGDCDSVSTLLASLLMASGFKADFVTVKAEPSSDEWTHVYVQTTLPDGTVIPLDCTMKTKNAGWEPKNMPRQVWPISKNDPQSSDVSGPDVAVVPMPTDDSDASDDLFGGAAVTMGGMRGLGDTPQESILSQILDGSMANQLEALRTKLNNQTGNVFNLQEAADKVADPIQRAQAVDMAQRAQNSLMQQKTIMYDAIDKYNQAAQLIQTYSLNSIKPRQLGFIPAALIPYLVAGATLTVLLIALSNTIGAVRGQANATEGYLSQGARLVSSAGVAIEQTSDASIKFGVVALVAAAAYIGFSILKKRGAF